MVTKDGNHILFLCDRRACGDVCPNSLCSHTGDIRHAKNFDFLTISMNGETIFVDYFELDEVADKETNA